MCDPKFKSPDARLPAPEVNATEPPSVLPAPPANVTSALNFACSP